MSSDLIEDDAKFVAGVQAGVDAGAYTARGVIIGLLAVITRLRTVPSDLEALLAEREGMKAEIERLNADAERLDWLEAEHSRVDPVMRLTVKEHHRRESHRWVTPKERAAVCPECDCVAFNRNQHASGCPRGSDPTGKKLERAMRAAERRGKARRARLSEGTTNG